MTEARAAAYPADREAEIVLRDGSTVHVRPVRAEDKAAIRTFLEGVSADSIAFRFFGTINLNWVTKWAVDVDYADRFALVVETGSPRRIIAHAAYIRLGRPSGAQAAGRRAAPPPRSRFWSPMRGRDRASRRSCSAHLAAVAERHGIGDVLRRGAAGEPPDDRRVPHERVSDRDALHTGCDRDRAANVPVRAGGRQL